MKEQAVIQVQLIICQDAKTLPLRIYIMRRNEYIINLMDKNIPKIPI